MIDPYELTFNSIDGHVKHIYFFEEYLRVGPAVLRSQPDAHFSDPLYSCYLTSEQGAGPEWVLPGCDNGILETSEQCDILYNDGIDGWESGWVIKSGYVCKPNAVGISVCVSTTSCGNGLLEADEECDDNNNFDTDGCSSICQLELGYQCTSVLNQLSVCSIAWGDGILMSPEVWDDGNDLDGKGCLVDWTGSMDGWTCSGGSLSTPDVWHTTWGDGIRVDAEVWDDGDSSNEIGCRSDWSGSSPYFSCVLNATTGGDTCTSACGDFYRTPDEACEDDNILAGDGCYDWQIGKLFLFDIMWINVDVKLFFKCISLFRVRMGVRRSIGRRIDSKVYLTLI